MNKAEADAIKELAEQQRKFNLAVAEIESRHFTQFDMRTTECVRCNQLVELRRVRREANATARDRHAKGLRVDFDIPRAPNVSRILCHVGKRLYEAATKGMNEETCDMMAKELKEKFAPPCLRGSDWKCAIVRKGWVCKFLAGWKEKRTDEVAQ